MFQRGGSVVCRSTGSGSCTAEQQQLPLSLTVALNSQVVIVEGLNVFARTVLIMLGRHEKRLTILSLLYSHTILVVSCDLFIKNTAHIIYDHKRALLCKMNAALAPQEKHDSTI